MIQAVDHPCKEATCSWDHKLSNGTSSATELACTSCCYMGLQGSMHGQAVHFAHFATSLVPNPSSITRPSPAIHSKSRPSAFEWDHAQAVAQPLPCPWSMCSTCQFQASLGFSCIRRLLSWTICTANLSPDSVQLPLSMPLTRGRSGSTRKPCIHAIP